jgi:hypothetical protein
MNKNTRVDVGGGAVVFGCGKVKRVFGVFGDTPFFRQESFYYVQTHPATGIRNQ